MAKRFDVDAVVEKKLVVVADVPVALVKVKVCNAVVPVAVRLPPMYASPATERRANGEVVPMPTFALNEKPFEFVASKVVRAEVERILNLLAELDCNSKAVVGF